MKRALLVVLLVLALVGAACAGDDEESSDAGGGPPVSLAGTTNEHGTKTATGEFEVEADDFYFEPTYIKATPGQAFTVEVHNEGKAPHTFTSMVLGIDEELQPGQKKTIKVTAPQSGTAVFICRFHQTQGMQGAVFIA